MENEGSVVSLTGANKVVLTAEWTPEHEQILVEWADKAMCYRWMHSKAHQMYSLQNAWYTIPVIVISTLTGTANFAQERVPPNYQYIFVMVVGGFNILAGIITTIQQFLKITQLNESHRVSSIAWDKFYRNIKIELAKHPHERLNVSQMIKISKEEFDRLMETSPSIPEKIVGQFKNTFKDKKNSKKKEEEDEARMLEPPPKIIKPEICDELVSTELFRNPWSSDENRARVTEMQYMAKKERDQKLQRFREEFFKINHREPLPDEIAANLFEGGDDDVLLHHHHPKDNSFSSIL